MAAQEAGKVAEYAVKPIGQRAVEALGMGFDLTSDFKLNYVKGGSERLVALDETNKRDIVLPACPGGAGEGATVRCVPEDIRCDKGEMLRFKSDVLEFNQMSELINQKSSVQGKVPSGYFNAMFDFSGSWLNDGAVTKRLAFDGYFVAFYYLHLSTSALVLHDKVKKSVPSHWDPASLSSFIKNFGTHVVVGMAIGGQDLVCVRQEPSSTVSPADLKANMDDLGDALFMDDKSPYNIQRKARGPKQKDPDVFNSVLQSNIVQVSCVAERSSKDGLTVIRSRRGGNVFMHSHSQWLQTVSKNPDAILFKFVPITSLLTGIQGSGYLSHAINLYLRYKPAPDNLQYFLEFQVPRQWAPMYCELPLQHQRVTTPTASLQFSFMGPKLHVNASEVSSLLKPIIGLRLFLEGRNCNHLAIHVQHLTSLPNSMTYSALADHHCKWRGSDEIDLAGHFQEPLRSRRFSSVCTVPVKHNPSWSQHGVFIVTGAQLITTGRWPKTILHLRLLFSHLRNCTVTKTEWAAPEASHKSSILTALSTTFTFTQRQTNPPKRTPGALNSGVYPNGPPVPVRSAKMLKYVNTGEVWRGPHDEPGHWVVTAARLVIDGGKISTIVKFALVDYEDADYYDDVFYEEGVDLDVLV